MMGCYQPNSKSVILCIFRKLDSYTTMQEVGEGDDKDVAAATAAAGDVEEGHPLVQYCDI